MQNELSNVSPCTSPTDGTLSRRKTLLGIAALAALPVVGASVARAQPAMGHGGAMDEYSMRTLMIGSLALQSSKLAQSKASDSHVKKFATLEAAEQTTIAEIMAAQGQTPPPLDEAHQKKLDALKDLDGKEFDEKYLDLQTEGHEMLLRVQKSKSGGEPKDIPTVVAKLAEQSVTSHLAMLEMIKDAMKNA